jgi:hypothetical protein
MSSILFGGDISGSLRPRKNQTPHKKNTCRSLLRQTVASESDHWSFGTFATASSCLCVSSDGNSTALIVLAHPCITHHDCGISLVKPSPIYTSHKYPKDNRMRT